MDYTVKSDFTLMRSTLRRHAEQRDGRGIGRQTEWSSDGARHMAHDLIYVNHLRNWKLFHV